MKHTVSLSRLSLLMLLVLSIQAFTIAQTYCNSSASNNGGEYISKVVFGSINSPSGTSFYTNFTSVVGNVIFGNTYTLTVTIFANAAWTEFCNAWIDFNNDGDFIDVGEVIDMGSRQGGGDFSSSVLISGSIGIRRMRVTLRYNAVPASCDVFGDGEVEDYSINITGGCSDIAPPTGVTLSANVSSSVINGAVQFNATALDNVGVTKVEFYGDAQKLGESMISPYKLGWTPLTAGAKSITSRAYDACGNYTNSSPVNVNVTNYCSN